MDVTSAVARTDCERTPAVAAVPARPLARVMSVATAFPESYYDQEALLAAARTNWAVRLRNPAHLEQVYRSVQVDGRHLALPLDQLVSLGSFTEASRAYVRCAVDLGEQAVRTALARAGCGPGDVRHVAFTSVTGIATPSIDARLMNRLGLAPDTKRTPIFGLGCVAGAAGIARVSDYLRAYPDQIAVLLSVELCSLTLQRGDCSIRNVVASGLFGDGAAAVVLGGAGVDAPGPAVLATRSIFYPGTEDVMGWDVTGDGFRIVLSADVPDVVRRFVRRDVDAFLAAHGLTRRDVASWVCHPGGPKVLRALEQALELDASALSVTWDGLRRVGNLSSASVLMVLGETMAARRPPRGSIGLMVAMGPGFCSELVLLRW